MNTTTSTNKTERELVYTRVFDAPRELVFKVWTEPEHIKHWWGPNGFTNTIHHMDARTGGDWDFVMHGPDGTDFPNYIHYLEVIVPERLVYLHGSSKDFTGRNFHVAVDFKALGKQTEITMRMTFETKEERDMVVEKFGAIEGNKQTMDRLEKYLQICKQSKLQ